MKIAKIRDVKTPIRSTKFAAGLDFFVPNDIGWDSFTLGPHQSINIKSGIKVKIPDGYALITFNKSGQALNKNLNVGAGVIDQDYCGEVHLHVRNIGNNSVTISKGEKLVQMLLVPVLYEEVIVVDEKDLHILQTERGVGGFGSTGI